MALTQEQTRDYLGNAIDNCIEVLGSAHRVFEMAQIQDPFRDSTDELKRVIEAFGRVVSAREEGEKIVHQLNLVAESQRFGKSWEARFNVPTPL